MNAPDEHAGRDAGAPRPQTPSLAPSHPLASKAVGRVMTSVQSPDPHLGWHSRGYLPHWDHPGMMQSLNFRLVDSLPRGVVEKWQNELSFLSQPESQRAIELRRRVEEYVDAGHGECWLKRPEIARLRASKRGAVPSFWDCPKRKPASRLLACENLFWAKD